MAIYTGVADANGDFNISFGSNNYTGGEKITVTSEKDNAMKSIELYAPSQSISPKSIKFSGDLTNFPNNIGVVDLIDFVGVIPANAFYKNFDTSLGGGATGLIIGNSVTSIEDGAFYFWSKLTSIEFGDAVTNIGNNAFNSVSNVTQLIFPSALSTIGSDAFYGAGKCLNVDLGQGVTDIGSRAFQNLSICTEVICRAVTPPTIRSSTFQNLNINCIFKVPAASIAAYQAAPNWSAFASRIQAI